MANLIPGQTTCLALPGLAQSLLVKMRQTPARGSSDWLQESILEGRMKGIICASQLG